MKALFIKKSSKGFTILELVISMAITMFIAILFVRLARDTTDSTVRFNNQLLTQQQIEQTLQLIVPEIRSISQGIDGAYPVAQATTSTFQFYSDIDGDGKIEKVQYFIASSTILRKGVIRPSGSPAGYATSSEVFYDEVSGLISGSQVFAYYDSGATSSASTALPSPIDVLKVKTVKITIVADQGTPGHPSLVGSETSATIRNLRYK